MDTRGDRLSAAMLPDLVGCRRPIESRKQLARSLRRRNSSPLDPPAVAADDEDPSPRVPALLLQQIPICIMRKRCNNNFLCTGGGENYRGWKQWAGGAVCV